MIMAKLICYAVISPYYMLFFPGKGSIFFFNKCLFFPPKRGVLQETYLYDVHAFL